MNTTTEIADLLREHLDIPVSITDEGGPYALGVNVWRTVRKDTPSTSSPYRGTQVRVMYMAMVPLEEEYHEWVRATRQVLVEAYPDRLRPMVLVGSAATLIEDADTEYSAWRAAQNAHRAALGFKPLHEIGQ